MRACACTHMQVEPFGSYASGLGTRNSDVDIVLLGLMEPNPTRGFYSKGERPQARPPVGVHVPRGIKPPASCVHVSPAGRPA